MTRTAALFVACAAVACVDVPAVDVVVVDAAGEGEGEGEGDVDVGEGEGEGDVGEGEAEGEGEGEGDVDDGPARYHTDRHSPLTADVAARLQALRAAHGELADDVFAKIGASNTVNTGFLTCFDGGSVDLGAHGALDDTRAFFAGGDAAGTSPYDRVSAAATVGWSAFHPLRAGDDGRAPVDVEVDALAPAYAVVMFGTNDIQQRNITRYADDLFALTDRLLARGVIPLLSSVPPRDDDAAADVEVPRYALVARMVAERQQIPFMDLNQALRPLAGHGLGGDGIHMNVDPRGGCRFDDGGLGFGFNQRNLLTLTALDRVRAAVDAGAVDDAVLPPRSGAWTQADPMRVDVLPFVAFGDTATSTSSLTDSYACAPGADESGPEQFMAWRADAASRLHVLVFDQGDVDVDVHVVVAGACVDRDDKEVVVDVDAGADVSVVFDTYGGAAQAGAYQVIVYRE
jgi:hypothetical protein